eukprot:m.18964 g.18964  ORF g.18964 m.18964 type:complete len:128 (-) comp12272_c0_seq1:323-706(-)
MCTHTHANNLLFCWCYPHSHVRGDIVKGKSKTKKKRVRTGMLDCLVFSIQDQYNKKGEIETAKTSRKHNSQMRMLNLSLMVHLQVVFGAVCNGHHSLAYTRAHPVHPHALPTARTPPHHHNTLVQLC